VIQYLPLDQVTAMAAFKNVPVIMMPVVPLYSMQFGQPFEQDGSVRESVDGEDKGQAQSENPYMSNGL
jgi:hypothetical protein